MWKEKEQPVQTKENNTQVTSDKRGLSDWYFLSDKKLNTA